MKIREDGSIQSHATPTWQNVEHNNDVLLYRCMVTKVIYVDDPANISTNGTNPRVMYDCVVLGGFKSGQIISNCRLSSILAGNDSYWERTLRASEKEVSQTRLSDNDGDIVFVQFIQGHKGVPVIVALDNGLNTANQIGSTKDQGPRSLRQYNGVREEINKDGELEIQVKGGTANSEKGSFKPSASALVTTKTSKDEKTTRTYKSGLKLEEDGKNDKITITTNSAVTVEIDGKNNKIILKKGQTIIELDGNGDKISLKGGFVDLGASVSDFAVLFTELLTAFNTHTHTFPYLAGPSPATGTTQPPVAPMPQTVGSLTVKVQP